MRKNLSTGEICDLRKTGSREPEDGPLFLRVLRFLSPLLVDAAVALIVGTVLYALIPVWLDRSMSEREITVRFGLLINAAADLVLLPVLILMFRSDYKRRLENNGASYRILERIPLRIPEVLKIGTAAVALNGALGVLLVFLPFDKEYEALSEILFQPDLFIQVAEVAVLTPLVEELIFRGLLYHRFRDRFGVMRAALISAVLFGISHGSLKQGIFAVLFGLFLALLYEHYGTIAAPVTAHLFNNLFAIVTEYFSGQIPDSVWVLYLLASVILTPVLIACIFKKKHRRNLL